ncbi:hypothetical protein KIN20_023754 [Parelaphostrongylus tenuis]|uniref:Uncharacterized protein n=1 Tax=Parelaphostrongylus tenuis TaxID=148309 RepID=A0AAD5MS77_PARTN|nr:hypothetical protein KIN20_023754 [Parelaphostrongylus tenuis]
MKMRAYLRNHQRQRLDFVVSIKPQSFAAECSGTFTVTEFTTLPVQMVHAASLALISRVSGIIFDITSAQVFVQRLVMQTVDFKHIFQVYFSFFCEFWEAMKGELQFCDKCALIPDAVITSILGQLEIRSIYELTECYTAFGPTDQQTMSE